MIQDASSGGPHASRRAWTSATNSSRGRSCQPGSQCSASSSMYGISSCADKLAARVDLPEPDLPRMMSRTGVAGGMAVQRSELWRVILR
jgi:hypothetical protein